MIKGKALFLPKGCHDEAGLLLFACLTDEVKGNPGIFIIEMRKGLIQEKPFKGLTDGPDDRQTLPLPKGPGPAGTVHQRADPQLGSHLCQFCFRPKAGEFIFYFQIIPTIEVSKQAQALKHHAQPGLPPPGPFCHAEACRILLAQGDIPAVVASQAK